jgi:LacI family transcriptional regulator
VLKCLLNRFSKGQMKRKITIDDVAKHAGVSKVTVSYVLNGRSEQARISTATQERVHEAANSLGFRANAVARSLSRRRTDSIGVVFQSGSYFSSWSAFTSEIMRGVSEACFEEGFDLMLHTKAVNSPSDEAATLADGRVDGVLILRDEDDETLRALVRLRLPCVQFFTHSQDPLVASVDLDNELGGRLATKHLLNLGHRRIAMICGSAHSVSSLERVAGYSATLRAAGIPVRRDWIVPATNYERDEANVRKLMEEPRPPTAFFVWSDDLAVSLMRQLREQGYNVPQDISIVGFDSSPAAENAVPALTSVHQPVRQMAARATQILIDTIRGNTGIPPKITISPHLDIRASTAPVSRHLTME